MGLCVTLVGKTITIAATIFSLSWTHSVEKTQWQEDWAVVDKELVLQRARVKGSGAGMDPGDGSALEAGWWVWNPVLPPVKELNLASSGETISGWKLCHGSVGTCIEFTESGSEPIRVEACELPG